MGRKLNPAPAAPKRGVVAEIIDGLATGNISVEVYGPDNHGANKPWLVSLRNADTDNADEYEGDTLAAALIAALATGEQSRVGWWRGCTKRSEEHTSELQSLMRISYAVFRLKKKKRRTHTHNTCISC